MNTFSLEYYPIMSEPELDYIGDDIEPDTYWVEKRGKMWILRDSQGQEIESTYCYQKALRLAIFAGLNNLDSEVI